MCMWNDRTMCDSAECAGEIAASLVTSTDTATGDVAFDRNRARIQAILATIQLRLCKTTRARALPRASDAGRAAHAAARFGRGAPLVRLRGGHDGRALIGTLLASPDMSPPDVKDPGGQGSHSRALFELKRSSEPHDSQPPLAERNVPARQNVHCVAPALENVRVSHSIQLEAPASDEYVPAGHSATVLVPSHAEPAGHAAQLVRVVFVPPEV